MFGRQRIEHDQRYVLAAELFDVLQRLWGETENFSYEGRSPWKLHNAFVTPKPRFGRPILVNATGSDAGIDFAARYSDIVFVTSPAGSDIESALEALPAHTARIKRAAASYGREIRALINPGVICRDTEKEANDFADLILANPVSAEQAGKRDYDSDAHAWRGRKNGLVKQGRGVGGNIEIIGTPEQVVDQLLALKDAGIDGVQLSFFDFERDLTYFGERVLPLMKQAGLRN